MIDRRSPCTKYAPAIEAFVDRREIGLSTAAALRHLESCPACEVEAERTARAVIALRRLGAEAAEAAARAARTPAAIDPNERDLETAADRDGTAAWFALRARVDRARPPAWRWRAQVAGVIAGVGIVAAVVAPASTLRGSATELSETGVDPSVVVDQARADARAEEQWLFISSRTRKEQAIGTPTLSALRDMRTISEDPRPEVTMVAVPAPVPQ